MKGKKSLRVPDHSEPEWDCPRCGKRMRKWKHAPEWVPPTDKGWFTFWFECVNKGCRTRQVMPSEGFVRSGGDPPIPEEHEPISAFDERTLCAEDIQRLEHFRGI